MTRFGKFASLILGVLLYFGNSNAQNIYDTEHSRTFAQFLLSSQQYHLAAMELERVIFMEPNNINAKHQLITAYRKAGEWRTGVDKIKSWYPISKPDNEFSREWIRLLLLDHDFPEAHLLLMNQANLQPAEQNYYKLATFMLSENYDLATKLVKETAGDSSISMNAEYTELSSLLNQHEAYKFKNPGIALGLSALLPGLGKVYTKDWKDGLISLLFVATNAWQAYRGFSKDGVQSIYGWIFGSMTIGFYGSSLYGSWRSANDYNTRLNNELHHEIEASVFNRF